MRLRKKWWAEDALKESGFVYFDGRPMKGKWQDVFAAPQPLYLELGSGRGKFLTHFAEKEKDKNFLGVDIEMNAMVYSFSHFLDHKEQHLPSVQLLKEAAQTEKAQELKKNMRFLVYNIQSLETVFESEEVDKIFINFCNPWPKLSHHKRRLTHPRQLVQYQKFLKEGGTLQLKTDDMGLYQDSLEYLQACGFEILEHTSNLAKEEDKIGILTEYETKWRGLGVPIKFILAKLRDKNQIPTEYLKDLPKSQAIFLERKQ